MKKRFCLLLILVYLGPLQAQDSTAHQKMLDSITINAVLNQQLIKPLPPVSGMFIFSGKKTEVIDLSQTPADVTSKIARQVFAKIPGVFVYDMDGAGNQINIASRGLDPHRGWEFNIRKDGILTNSDMYGYPASHYSMPLESISRVELVRGTGSLQYGAQFGGMLNYVSKQADSTRPVSFESISTAGSYNLLSTYNAIGGTIHSFSYYAYLHKKTKDGYRDNEHTNSDAEGIILTWEPSARISLRFEWSRSKYIYRIPGPLNDSMYLADPTQSTRSRNYFSPAIHIPSFTLGWNLSPATKLQYISSAVLGKRSSVMFDKPANIKDSINASTLQYNNRQVDIDNFNSYTNELRVMQSYKAGRQTHIISAGIQYMNNDLHRTQLGKGTTGSGYDLTLVTPGWGRDLHFKTTNWAFFAENKFQLTSALSLSAGARVESGTTHMSGTITYYPDNQIPLKISHRFPLLGVSVSYKPSDKMECYGGWSQAYRPMLFKDVIPASLFERVDPNLKDSKGYNAEAGCRGNWKFLRWDVNAFVLRYDNRFGTLALTDNAGNFYTFRTNIGNSFTKGLEVLLQANWLTRNRWWFSVFTSTAFIQARYKNAAVKSGNNNIDISGHKVESAPGLISRNGFTIRHKKISFSGLYSYTAESFADALNTREPQKGTGAVGLVPSYGLLDLNVAVRFSHTLEWRLGCSNVTDKNYFTKRPLFYPGPGVWPSDGRNWSTTITFRL